MRWIGCVCWEKFRCDFMARTCALIMLVQPVLHRVSCSNETLPNAPKQYETDQNMNLGSNGVDRVRSLRKIPLRLRHELLLSLHQFSSFCIELRAGNETIQNAAKHYETHQNMSLGSNGVDRVRSLRKILMRLRGTNLCINYTSSTYFASSFV